MKRVKRVKRERERERDRDREREREGETRAKKIEREIESYKGHNN